ncbi:winged helix-turn-helix transcriptional regulator [bacterium]|nr:winged helix-turn-helix transcriptional regulator [bacterium]
MKSTRDRILQTLLANPHSTISELAEAVKINNISVRHHLTSLQAEGSIIAEEERHGVGRPRLVYSLTESGQEKFPTRYLQLTDRLLTHLKQALPELEYRNLFTDMAKDLASEQGEKIKTLPLEEKLEILKENLETEGFSIEWEQSGDEYRINEVACPFYHIGQSHPEVCAMDQTLISTWLSIPTEKVQCVLNGDNLCSYVIKKQNSSEVLK